MKESLKNIIALGIAGSIMLSSSGCGNNKIKYEYNNETKQEQLVGTADLDEINNYYIVELKDLEGNTNLFLTYEKFLWLANSKHDERYRRLGTKNDIAIENYTSKYGEVLGIYPFTYFITMYSDIKNNYTADEINEIFNKVKENYNTLKEKEEVIKLKLKKTE